MADHINIHHPDGREVRRRIAIEIAELQARIKVLNNDVLDMESDLNSIFTRIERGDEVELHMQHGGVFVVTGKLRVNDNG